MPTCTGRWINTKGVINHLQDDLEDAATGVAAGALSLHLAKKISVSQGVRLGNSCLITAYHNDGSSSVGGMVLDA